MRAGACSVHQTLSPEASSVLQHSLHLARRRGHAQLTPLHVAATLLTSSSRFASTLKSSSSPHPHPLRFRALELCLNVSLNRLPATGGHHHLLHSPPSLSNALIAALKRAQAHQKRSGFAEENCFLSTKVDLDQLIMSILDDPSVSRVMREAGFSSISAKSNLEDRRKSSVMNYGRLDFRRSEQNPTMDDTRDSRILLSKGSLHCRKEGQDNVLRCCPECLSNFEKEYASAQLPYYLKIHANDSHDNKECLVQLTRKYNRLCQSLHGNTHHHSPMDSLKSTEGIRVRTTLSLGNPDDDEKISYCGRGSGSGSSVVPMKLIVHESKHGRRVSDFNPKRPRSSFSSSSYAFDLNVKADNDDEGGQFSPVSSDLTREVTVEQQSSLVFREWIKQQLVLNRDSDAYQRVRGMLLSKLKCWFSRVGDCGASFEVEESVLEEVLRGSGFCDDGLIEKWVNDVFGMSVGMVVGVGEDREKVIDAVRLCLDGEPAESCGDDGFMGTCLPKTIQLCFIK